MHYSLCAVSVAGLSHKKEDPDNSAIRVSQLHGPQRPIRIASNPLLDFRPFGVFAARSARRIIGLPRGTHRITGLLV